MKLSTFIGLLLLPCSLFANGKNNCGPHNFLFTDFDLEAFSACQTRVKQCPTTGPVPSQDCEKQIYQTDIRCKQSSIIAKKFATPLPYIEALPHSAYVVFKKTFLADGQEQYYILTPAGCLIDTVIDPRKLDSIFSSEHKKETLIIMNDKAPEFQTLPDGTERFVVFLKINRNCKACDEIAKVSVNFDFNKKGKLSTTVANIQKN